MRFGGILLAAALLLGACSSDPEPQEPPPSPTPSSTATLPAMPEQAKEDSPEGAAAFVDHWVDVFNYASQTGDVTELSKLSSPDCKGCQTYIDLYRDTYAKGGYFKGGEWSVSDIETERESDAVVRVFVHIDGEAGEVVASQGEAATPGTPEDTELLFRLGGNGAWEVREITRRQG